MIELPIFEHDCDNCKFLGSLKNINGECDLYCHPPNKDGYNESLIIRYSSEPSNYASGIIFAYIADMKKEYDSHYYIAMKKAIELGFIKQKEYFVGYSSKKHDEEYDKYFDTSFYKK